MANLRPEDKTEVLCQFPESVKRHELAYMLLQSLEAWVVRIDDAPVAVFGVAYMNEVCVSVWAVGTKRMRRAVPAITRYVRDDMVPRLEQAGFCTMEARSFVGHAQAHQWMVATGAVQADQPYIFGRNGEKFVTFRWTSETNNRKSQHNGDRHA